MLISSIARGEGIVITPVSMTALAEDVKQRGRHVDAIASRFLPLASHPRTGRARDGDLGPGTRSFPAGDHVIVYDIDGADVRILRMVHGSRDLGALFGH